MQIFHFSLYSQFFLEQINDFGKTGEIWMEFEMSSGLREETYWVRQIKSRHKKEGVMIKKIPRALALNALKKYLLQKCCICKFSQQNAVVANIRDKTKCSSGTGCPKKDGFASGFKAFTTFGWILSQFLKIALFSSARSSFPISVKKPCTSIEIPVLAFKALCFRWKPRVSVSSPALALEALYQSWKPCASSEGPALMLKALC